MQLNASENSPEATISKLLIEDKDYNNNNIRDLYQEDLNASSTIKDPKCFSELESLLLRGQREAAIDFALEHKEWVFALLISSLSGPLSYQRVVKEYADSNLPQGSPLHTLTLIYSNQNKIITAKQKLFMNDNENCQHYTLTTQWKKSLAAIISNKGTEWDKLGRSLGDRIFSDNKVRFIH